jgi:mRNA interferase MazF
MPYKKGDILLIRFPFTDLSHSKKRPIVLLQDENESGDFICFQITSKTTQSHLSPILQNDLNEGELPLSSYVKYDKCFTLNSAIVDKKLAAATDSFLRKLKELLCEKIL